MPDPSDSRRSAQPGSGNGWLHLDVVDEAGDWAKIDDAEGLALAAGAALARHRRFKGAPPSEACIALADDATVRALNSRYRGKDKATNVLSFPAAAPAAHSGPRNLGDVILACETVLLEARRDGIAPAHHLQHLVVHGLLHLLGFEHETGEEARDMEALEVEILASLGVPDPYCGSEPRLAAQEQ
jgi:probable rRNA maturation factor